MWFANHELGLNKRQKHVGSPFDFDALSGSTTHVSIPSEEFSLNTLRIPFDFDTLSASTHVRLPSEEFCRALDLNKRQNSL